ncbi:MAG: ATP synthase F1 subunit delta [Candidatus Omnitrophica bacterium]|nr:ATP synthase F1 subunit delta [Candidatus Omnitrophota bacterium]
MAQDPIPARYAQALFETAKAERAVERTLEQLTLVGRLFHDHPALRQFLRNPDVEPADKVGVLDRALKGSWSPLVQAFLRMVLAMGRAEYLPQVVDAFQAAVDADQGRLRAVVRSARPLSAPQLARLRTALAHREHLEIELKTEVDPTLLGGVAIRLGHRVIDGTVRRQLADLRERLHAVRVA